MRWNRVKKNLIRRTNTHINTNWAAIAKSGESKRKTLHIGNQEEKKQPRNIKEEIKKIANNKKKHQKKKEIKRTWMWKKKFTKLERYTSQKDDERRIQERDIFRLSANHNGIVWLRNVLKHTLVYRSLSLFLSTQCITYNIITGSRCTESKVSNSRYRSEFRSRSWSRRLCSTSGWYYVCSA